MPKEREVNSRREVCEWEGRVCAREAGAPSMLRLIRRAVVLARMLPTLDLRFVYCEDFFRSKIHLDCALNIK